MRTDRTAGLVIALLACASVIARPDPASAEASQVPPPPTTQTPPGAPTAAPADPNAVPEVAGTGTISGVVTDRATGRPLAGATVYLGPPSHGPPGEPIRQLTDSRGRFVFTRLPTFRSYFLQVSMFGYFTGRYGRGSSGQLGSRIALAEGEWFGEADVAMERPAVISGRVLDERGEPLVGVFVRVLPRMLIAGRSQLVAGPATTTDDRGVYRIAGLTPGDYVVHVPIVQSTVPPSVFDSDQGDRNAPRLPGEPTVELAGPGSTGHRVIVGSYSTPLPQSNGRAMAYPTTFYPGTPSLTDAAVIAVESGEERANVDLQIAPVETYRISGQLTGPPEAWVNMTLRLMPPGAEHLGTGSEAATTLAEPDGSFTFLNVPAGAYTIIGQHEVMQYEARFEIGATRNLPAPPAGRSGGSSGGSVISGPEGLNYSARRSGEDTGWRGQAPVTVDGNDVTGLTIPLTPGVTLSGRFVHVSGDEDVAWPRIVRLEPADGNPTLGVRSWSASRASRDDLPLDRFSVTGLLPGRYQLQAIGGVSRIVSVVWNGRDYTDRPIDTTSGMDITDLVVTLTDERIELSGTVRDAQGLVVEDAAVIVFPTAPDLWTDFGFSPRRVKAIQTTNDGQYRFQSLPAGDYLAVAVDLARIDDWKDPAFLERAARSATSFSVDWGETTTQDLRLVVVR